MKRLIAAASLLVLVGAGCASAPAAEPAPSAQEQPAPSPAPAPAPAPSAKPTPAPVTVPNSAGISPEDSEDRVVVFDGNGFVPKNVAVHVGRTVTWTNQSTQNVWPASNPHPVHTDCPGFDAKKPIKPGESYSFTFTKAGTCDYHNHLLTGISGQVMVTPKAP